MKIIGTTVATTLNLAKIENTAKTALVNPKTPWTDDEKESAITNLGIKDYVQDFFDNIDNAEGSEF